MDCLYSVSSTSFVAHVTFFTIFFFIERLALVKFVFRPIFEPLITVSDEIEKDEALKKKRKDKEFRKLCESAFRICYYLPMAIWEWLFVYRENYLTHTKQFWIGYPNHPVTYEIMLFYSIQLGFYIFLQVSHIFFDTRRKDFVPLLIHHFVTIALVGYSWSQGYFRIGIFVFSTMDGVDVFLDTAKVFNYLQKELVANIAFVLLVVSWVVFRIILFPWKLIGSVYYESLPILTESGVSFSVSDWYIFMLLLIIIQMLQAYWLYLIIRVAYRLIVQGKIDDVTDKEHQDDKIKAKKTK